MNKRGQIYLISAIILIMILGAFVTMSNYSKRKTFSTLPYIAEEINIEAEKVMDYVLLSGDETKLTEFTQEISDSLDEDTIIYFITDGKCYEGYIPIEYDKCTLEEDKIEIRTGVDESYEFPLTEGKHFYYVMIKEERGEKYVFTNA